MAVHGAAAPAHQYASRFLRVARPIARPGAGEHARAARGPVAPRAQLLLKRRLPKFSIQLSGEHQAPAHAAQATTRSQTYPGASPRADLHPKKVNKLDPMAPRSRKKRQLPETLQ
jgi:hypothetical protein